MDLDIALSHVENDLDLLSELADMFVRDYPRLVETAAASIAAGDCAELERAAHTLKGRLAFFGVLTARPLALDLEMMARDRDLTRAGEKLAELESAMRSVLAKIEALRKDRP